MFFSILLILVPVIALFSYGRAFMALSRMQLLTSNYWKENGIENILLPFLWIMLMAGGIGLLFNQPWAKLELHLTLLLLLAFTWISGIWQIWKLNIILRKGGEAKNSISKFNLEILQKTGLSFFDPQRINNFARRESNFFISETDPEDTDNEDIEKSKLDAHVRKHFRKQIIAAIINAILATGLIGLTWWRLE
jgi:hypothetical protein